MKHAKDERFHISFPAFVAFFECAIEYKKSIRTGIKNFILDKWRVMSYHEQVTLLKTLKKYWYKITDNDRHFWQPIADLQYSQGTLNLAIDGEHKADANTGYAFDD